MGEEQEKVDASAERLNEEQADTTQDPQVEVTHPDAFARKQYESDQGDPETPGMGNNPTAEQGGVGKTEYTDEELDPSQQGSANEEE